MKIPYLLEQAIENKAEGIKLIELKQSAHKLSTKYMNEERTGKSLLSEEKEAVAYSIMRMPATFCAITVALQHVLNIVKHIEIDTVLDIGAGTGATVWATKELLNPSKVVCIEREKAMLKLGQDLMADNPNMHDVEWQEKDIVKEDIPSKADLIIVSYVVNELKEEEKNKFIQKLLNLEYKILLIVEPGTPEWFKNIKEVQSLALQYRKNIIAPCTCQEKCKLPENDWCHATVRVERNKIHKILKSGDSPFEDEKFSYIAISNEEFNTAESRILRHPKIEAGKITLKLCRNGEIKEEIITKKEKDKFKLAKKKKCGDEF